nr:YlaH-like family protein [Paenibacillus sp. GP183]
MNEWFYNHMILTYILIFILLSFVYNRVFRTRKLPVLKALIIYLLIGIGAILLLFFQLVGLPIILCLCAAILMMLILRIRYFIEKRSGRRS